MTAFDETVACVDTCGARVGAPCVDADGRPTTTHVGRRRRAERHVSRATRGERARGADLRAIEDGAASLQELARDSWRHTFESWHAEPRTIKAWRVALACALLDKVYGARSCPVYADAIARWPSPFRVLVADKVSLYSAFRPLGLGVRRAHAWRLASERAIHEPGSLGVGDSYEAQSIRLVVDGNTGFEPDDKVLRVVRRRMLKGDPS